MDDYRITRELLEKHKACTRGREWFAEAFPSGASWEELEERLRKEDLGGWLEWGFEHVAPPAALERALYDPDCYVRLCAAHNPATPEAALEKAFLQFILACALDCSRQPSATPKE